MNSSARFDIAGAILSLHGIALWCAVSGVICVIDAVSREYGFPDFPRSWFGQTWWYIYGKENWQANPWVWVVEFINVS